MTLTKMVDGVVIELTPEEEAETLARWAAWEAEQANKPPPQPIPVIVASGNFTVIDGEISNLSVVSGIPAAIAVDTGTYWLFFTEPQPDTSYIVSPSASGGQINVTSRTTDFFELCVKDGGTLINPAEFSVSIVRSQ